MIESTELYHHGILGQKWGIRRFQPYSVTGPRKSGKAGREIGEASKVKTREKTSMKQKFTNLTSFTKKKAAEAKKSNDEKLKQRKEEDRKKKAEKIIASGKAKPLAQNYHEMTEDEIISAIQKIELERRIDQLHQREQEDSWKKFTTLSKQIGDVSLFVTNSTNAYNGIATIYNSIKSADSPSAPILKDGSNRINSTINEAVRKGDIKKVLEYAKAGELSTNDWENAKRYYDNMVLAQKIVDGDRLLFASNEKDKNNK